MLEMMQRPSWTVILSAAFLAYISYSMWMIGSLFYPTPCPAGSKCLTPYITTHPAFELSVYTSTKQRSKGRDLKLIWNYSNFSIHDTVEKTVNVTLPSSTLNNGSMWVHVFLAPRGDIAHQSSLSSSDSLLQTMYMVPEAKAYNLIGDSEDTDVKVGAKRVPITHWRSRLTIGVMEEDISFARRGVPQELAWLLRVTPEQQYLPLLYIDRLSNRIRDLMPVNKTSNVLPLTITYTPFSIGKLRLWITMTESIHQLQNLGFSEKDTDEVKGIFADTNFYILMMTFMVSALHLLFDFLAFKNDISYWKERKTMVGLSTRAVVWRCVSTIIIFLYLLDEETSMLVLVPSGIGAIIELWKVSKAFKVKITWTTTMPSISFGEASDKEKETQAFDAEAMYYLSFLMIPLSLCGAVYSLLYTPHKSWYSWCLQSLVHGVYMFGFLFMLPQLFVNYKLKSVAHLPWRAFMYKAFNTFIDDIFAFIITMPTAHRLACFRDDFIFVIYLYQRWLYPVDKTRVNEFGQSFEDQDDGDMKETKKSK